MITTDAFAALSQEEQISALEQMGRLALARLGVEPAEMQSLVHAENTTFRVESPQGRFCLRIHRPGYQHFASIQSELEWLSALRRDTALQVPDPVRTADGELVLVIESPEVPEARNVVLFHWLEGDKRGPTLLTYADMLEVGAAIAGLHEHSAHWKRPEGFQRHRLDQTEHYARERFEVLFQPHPWLTEVQRAGLLELLDHTLSMMDELGFEPDVHGLIHADLHRGNCLFEQDRLKIIDFDDCGFGHFLYDFASSLAFIHFQEDYPEYREALFCGYERVRPLPPDSRRLLGDFLRLRYLALIRWMIERSEDNPEIRDSGASYVERFLHQIERSYKTEGIPIREDLRLP